MQGNYCTGFFSFILHCEKSDYLSLSVVIFILGEKYPEHEASKSGSAAVDFCLYKHWCMI